MMSDVYAGFLNTAMGHELAGDSRDFAHSGHAR
jgi:hypothetical protein